MRDLKIKKCLRCKEEYTEYPAVSRRDNKTKICPDCGVDEATFDFLIHNLKEQHPDCDYTDFIKSEKKWISDAKKNI